MTDASPRFRSVLDSVPVYKPGRTPVSASGKTHKLSSNESPHPPLPSVVDVIAEAARSVHRYPDNGAQALIRAIADKFGVPAEHVAVGCGSVGVAQQLLEAVGEPGAEVMYAWRSFEAYPILSDLAGADSVRVPLRDQAHDLAADVHQAGLEGRKKGATRGRASSARAAKPTPASTTTSSAPSTPPRDP